MTTNAFPNNVVSTENVVKQSSIAVSFQLAAHVKPKAPASIVSKPEKNSLLLLFTDSSASFKC
jgi:hypothetical protein